MTKKWNMGMQFEHTFDIVFSIATDKPWEDLTDDELYKAVSERAKTLRGEMLESARYRSTEEFE